MTSRVRPPWSSTSIRSDMNTDEKQLRPKLTLFVQLENGLAVDATLTPETKRYLENLAAKQGGRVLLPVETEPSTDPSCDIAGSADEVAKNEYRLCHSSLLRCSLYHRDTGQKNLYKDHNHIQRIEVPLTFDTEFFGVLHNDVRQLDTIQDSEKEHLINDITALSKDVSSLSKPSKFSKSDMYKW